MAIDLQKKSETINKIWDLFQQSKETVATLEQIVLRFEQTMAIKDDIMKTFIKNI